MGFILLSVCNKIFNHSVTIQCVLIVVSILQLPLQLANIHEPEIFMVVDRMCRTHWSTPSILEVSTQAACFLAH